MVPEAAIEDRAYQRALLVHPHSGARLTCGTFDPKDIERNFVPKNAFYHRVKMVDHGAKLVKMRT